MFHTLFAPLPYEYAAYECWQDAWQCCAKTHTEKSCHWQKGLFVFRERAVRACQQQAHCAQELFLFNFLILCVFWSVYEAQLEPWKSMPSLQERPVAQEAA